VLAWAEFVTMADNSVCELAHKGTCRSLDNRPVRYNVTEWGDPDVPTFFYLHALASRIVQRHPRMAWHQLRGTSEQTLVNTSSTV